MSEDLNKLTKEELIKRLNEEKSVSGDLSRSIFESEMNKLDNIERQTKDHPYSLPVLTKNHPTVTLWRPLGLKIGPLSFTNARSTMRRYARAGIPLFTKKPTEEEIEEFKKTDLYKREHKKHLALRRKRKAQSKKTDPEELASKIARETGKAVAQELAIVKR